MVVGTPASKVSQRAKAISPAKPVTLPGPAVSVSQGAHLCAAGLGQLQDVGLEIAEELRYHWYGGHLRVFSLEQHFLNSVLNAVRIAVRDP